MIMEFIVGLVALITGIVAISRPTRDLHPAIKYTPIILCAVGAFNIWKYASQEIPVVADAKVSVMEVDSDKMFISVEPSLARKCKLRALDLYFVDSSNNLIRAPASFVDPKNYALPSTNTQWSLGNILQVQINPRKYESFYLVAHDRCAFDVHVRSEFGHTLVPQKFNAGLPTGKDPMG